MKLFLTISLSVTLKTDTLFAKLLFIFYNRVIVLFRLVILSLSTIDQECLFGKRHLQHLYQLYSLFLYTGCWLEKKCERIFFLLIVFWKMQWFYLNFWTRHSKSLLHCKTLHIDQSGSRSSKLAKQNTEENVLQLIIIRENLPIIIDSNLKKMIL